MSRHEEQALVNGLMSGRMSRRQFVRRATILGLSASTIGSVLAACGGSGGDVPVGGPAVGGQPTTAPGQPTTPPPPTPVVALIGSGSTQVKNWHGLGGADGATLATMLKQYSTEKQVSVQSETYDWGVFYQKLPTSIVGQTPPDMAVMHADRVAQFKQQNLVQRADTIFFDPGLLPKDDFRDDLLQNVTADGQIIAVPFDQHGWGMYVNTELLDKAGYNFEEMPASGDELIEWATKLTTDKAGKHPDEDGFNPNQVQQWGVSYGGTLTLFSTIWQFGGDLFDIESKKASLNSENTTKAVQWWYDAFHKHRISPVPGSAEIGAQDLYAANRLAMMYDGTWALNFFKDRPPIEKKTKAVYVPKIGNDHVAWYGSHLLAVPTGVPEERIGPARDLIVWLSNNSAEWATSGQIPARTSAQEDPKTQNIWSAAVFSKMFAEIGRTLPSHPALSELSAAWDPAFSAAFSKTTPVKQALDQANQQMQAVLDR